MSHQSSVAVLRILILDWYSCQVQGPQAQWKRCGNMWKQWCRHRFRCVNQHTSYCQVHAKMILVVGFQAYWVLITSQTFYETMYIYGMAMNVQQSVVVGGPLGKNAQKQNQVLDMSLQNYIFYDHPNKEQEIVGDRLKVVELNRIEPLLSQRIRTVNSPIFTSNALLSIDGSPLEGILSSTCSFFFLRESW